MLGQGGRLVLLGALLGFTGAAVANLVRGHRAALGIAFGYLVLVETSVRALGDASQQWLLDGGLVLGGGAALVVVVGSVLFVRRDLQ